MTRIPHRDEITDAGEEAAFSDTEKDAAGKETSISMHEAHGDHDHAPRHHDGGDPDARSEALQDQITRDLGRDVEGEEDGKGIVVIQPAHVEVSLEVDESCVAHIGAVQEAETESLLSERVCVGREAGVTYR